MNSKISNLAHSSNRVTESVWASLTADEKRDVMRAASLEGRTISNFIRVHIVRVARDMLGQTSVGPTERK